MVGQSGISISVSLSANTPEKMDHIYAKSLIPTPQSLILEFNPRLNFNDSKT